MAEGNGSGPAPWTAEQVRRARSTTVECPSGMVVGVRHVHAADLAAQGVLPEPLTRHVFSDLADLKAAAQTPEEAARVEVERVDLINAVVAAFVSSPEVVTGPVEDVPPAALHVSELPWPDRLHLFLVASGQVEAGLARFPGGQAGGVEGASGGGEVRAATVKRARTRTR